ncbi:MAG: hypothetical protein LBL19_08155 [Spirochaetaceae bacterium]|jgi:hypothetical protein|nr:hypothetical protein [Spirochaetaceae bacterium]
MVKPYKKIIIIFGLILGVRFFPGASEVDLSIRFYDKRVYYIPGAVTEPILVQVTLANKGPAPYHFRLAEDRIFSVDFEVKTLTNRPLEAAGLLVRKRTQSAPVFFRDISVESGESFSFIEDIRDYVALDQAGSFVLQVKMYPDLIRNTAGGTLPLESNRLSLHLRPPALPGPGGIPLAMDVETNAILVRESLPPDQVVEYTLRARQKNQWEKFFLYLDLEAMLRRDPQRQRQWQGASEEVRLRMIDQYRTGLENAVVDGDIATIPLEFRVERTTYNAEEGTVSVLEFFRFRDIIEKKRYTYDLRLRDDIWTIVGYTVQNLGTE